MPWPERSLKTWQDFVCLGAETGPGLVWGTDYVYRGQANADWSLVSSLGRMAAECSIDRRVAVMIEKAVAEEWRRTKPLYFPGDSAASPPDWIADWAAMQHLGAPTRLLDWTRSVYVAAYFAVADNWNQDGAVWMFHAGGLRKKTSEASGVLGLPHAPGEGEQFLFSDEPARGLFVIDRSSANPRSHAQQGLFTVSADPTANHGEIICDTMKASPEAFQKIRIPAAYKPLFLKRLREMNVAAHSLFPGLEGLAISLREMARIAYRQSGPRGLQQYNQSWQRIFAWPKGAGSSEEPTVLTIGGTTSHSSSSAPPLSVPVPQPSQNPNDHPSDIK